MFKIYSNKPFLIFFFFFVVFIKTEPIPCESFFFDRGVQPTGPTNDERKGMLIKYSLNSIIFFLQYFVN